MSHGNEEHQNISQTSRLLRSSTGSRTAANFCGKTIDGHCVLVVGVQLLLFGRGQWGKRMLERLIKMKEGAGEVGYSLAN